MKEQKLTKMLLLSITLTSVFAFAQMTVDKSNGVLTITSDESGTGTAKIVGPNDEVIVETEFKGTFSWTPSGEDGAYRYDVRVGNDYAGGSVEVRNGQLENNTKKERSSK